MKIKPVKGTKDYLPAQAELREYIQQTILQCYRENGFQRIMTPAVEDAENLDKSDGGDNLNLIFRILKRGEKLDRALAEHDSLTDMGLRYDLTLPLARYFSANRQSLAMPFRCIQIDKVYRAENPQKGRLREFMQCDIDVIGDNSVNCEIELIAITAKALGRLDIGEFTIKVNDRSVLNTMLLKIGFAQEQLASVCISFDKLDKIGADGVIAELREKGFAEDAINGFAALLTKLPLTTDDVAAVAGEEACERLRGIIDASAAISAGKYGVEFDISLVRGQGYYTGTVFEVRSDKFNGAVGGGGRYDGLVGKFTGEKIPACGFSIGFERIFGILSDMGRAAAGKEKIALVYDGDFAPAYEKAEELRRSYDVALYRRPKNMKAFLDKLAAGGFNGFTTDAQEIKQFN